jgi:hypothetical protein
MLTAVVSGIYITVTVWRGEAWTIMSLGALILVIALSQALTAPRMAAIGRALASENGALSKTFHSLANHPLPRISIQIRVAIALGIVFLQTVKPHWGGSLLTIGVAIILGVASDLPISRRMRVQEGPAD